MPGTESSQERFFEAHAKLGDAEAIEWLRTHKRPALFADLHPVWEIFWMLSDCRDMALSVGPIPPPYMIEFLQFYQLEHEHEIFEYLLHMDREYRRIANEVNNANAQTDN
jgi:hypothetical protein